MELLTGAALIAPTGFDTSCPFANVGACIHGGESGEGSLWCVVLALRLKRVAAWASNRK